MVLEALSPQRTALTSLANVWMAEGAAAVTISIGGIPVVSLPAGIGPDAAGGHPAVRQAQLAAPIHWEGQLAGEIRIMGAVSESAQARVAAEAQLVGLLLESEADLASMTDQLIQTQDQLLAVYDLGQLARRPMRLAERLLALTEAAGRLMNVEGASMVLASDGSGPVAAQYPPGAQDEAWLLALLPLLSSADGSSPDRAVLWQGGVRLPSLPDQVRSLLMVPMGTGGQAQGAFIFWSQRDERFASPDTKLASAIAEHAGVQVENALLQQALVAQARLETEMLLARRVQTSLLPKALPSLPGLDLYACTRPASHVGGDYFDFVPGSAESTVFLVSDVSGKGMSAALVVTMMRTILRSVIGQAKKASDASALPRPASLLALVNDEMLRDLTELSMFVTAFVAQYDHPSRRLRYANAGHSPVIYMPAGSRPRLLDPDCPPIGVMPALQYVERSLTLRPGDLLVAASDGFNEARNAADEMFGLERLLQYVEEVAHLPARAVGQALFATVEAFRDGEMQEDDQTMVIAKGT
jgi:phosphoserine phosphatase RsbU/P